MSGAFPIDDVRRRFPALERAAPFIFFDNAGGSQIPSSVLDAVADHLVARNVQRGGPYRLSREVDAAIARARESVAALVNARGADEIAFGLNATSFIRAISLAVGQSIGSRREIVVSELDHEANVATWLALERVGARAIWWRARDDGRLHASDLDAIVSDRTRLVACTMASNATGTLVDVAGAARAAHRVGAELFVDAVHYAPHGSIDVQRLDCDYLVCSGYKLFAPHMGFAWCRREAINALPTFREHFIPDVTPDKLEAGTYAYENVAGMDAAVAYLEHLGRGLVDLGARRLQSSVGVDDGARRLQPSVGVDDGARRLQPSVGSATGASEAHRQDDVSPRGAALRTAMTRITAYERALSRALLDQVETIPGVTVHGVTDRERLHERVPTLSFTVSGAPSAAIASALASRDVGVRAGHMYSPRLVERLGLMPEGVVRASLVHYNTIGEIARFRSALVDAIDEARSTSRR